VDPATLPADHPDWDLLEEDLVQIRHLASGALVDVGWYPPGRPAGAFRLVVVIDGDWAHPAVRTTARSLDELRAALDDVVSHPERLPPPIPDDVLVARLSDPDRAVRADAADRLADRAEVRARKRG
jgi:hypothetical protein